MVGTALFSRIIQVLVLSSVLCGTSEAAEITVLPDKNPEEAVIVIEGPIVLSDAAAFRAKASLFSRGMVVFRSHGGSAAAGIEIGKVIRLRNFSTWVPSGWVCESACAIAWLGGSPRAMGRNALIGFHAAYLLKDGQPKESGMANALVGSYLGQLGLSDRAIVYFTYSAPKSMAYLTPQDANAIGLDVKLLDLPNQVAEKTVEPAPLKERSAAFIINMYHMVSGPNDKMLSWAEQSYADSAIYFGKTLARAEIISTIAPFLERWPTRSYRPREHSVKIVCDQTVRTCSVKGLLDFRAESVQRNVVSSGTATFNLTLAISSSGNVRIIAEGGATVERHKEALKSPTVGTDTQAQGFRPVVGPKANIKIAPVRPVQLPISR
jgi:hypothetical protein